MSYKFEKCRTNILHLIVDIKNCARQVKLMILIAEFKAKYEHEIPFDAFFGWIQTSHTQVGMLISHIYKLANLNESKKNLTQNLSKVFNKHEVEKLFEWTNATKEWELFSQEYYKKFYFVRNKHISHAVYEKHIEGIEFELPKMYYRLACLDDSLGSLLYLVDNPHWLALGNPFTNENIESPIHQLNEFFESDSSIQDFQNLLNFLHTKSNSKIDLTPHLYPCY